MLKRPLAALLCLAAMATAGAQSLPTEVESLLLTLKRPESTHDDYSVAFYCSQSYTDAVLNKLQHAIALRDADGVQKFGALMSQNDAYCALATDGTERDHHLRETSLALAEMAAYPGATAQLAQRDGLIRNARLLGHYAGSDKRVESILATSR